MRIRTTAVGLFAVLGMIMGWLAEPGAAQDQAAQRKDFVSDASFVVGTFESGSAEHTPAAMKAAANAFLESLGDEQRKKCQLELKSSTRREWTNLPARPDADGVKMSDLSDEQVKHACRLMASLLSEQGFNKVRDIMLADDQLLDGGKPRPGFGTENFSIVIFGQPSETKAWGFQLDGHHVGANISIEGDAMTMSPSFIGTQPHIFKIAGKEYQPFAGETGLAHQLAMSLSTEQIKQAVLQPNRARIMTGPGNDGLVPESQGVPCASFSDDQKKLTLSLIQQWVGDLPEAQSRLRMQQLKKELDQMHFSWNGSREPKSDVSYRLQSPSLIIEYACQDLGNDPLDHLHSNYRDPSNEYGGQLK